MKAFRNFQTASGSTALIVISIGALFLEVITVQISRRYVDDVPILDLSGRFVVCADPDRRSLRTPVAKLVSEGHVNVLVHLARVTDIDAQGLGELAWGSATLRGCGGQMALIAPNLRVRQLLALTRLDTILTVYDCEGDAIIGAPAPVTSAMAIA